MKKIILLLLTALTITSVQAGPQETYAKFVILEAMLDGVDHTDTYIENSAFLVIYSCDEELCFANVWQKSQSYGTISGLAHTQPSEETSNTYKSAVFTFRWSYANDYDNDKGSCFVELTKIYKPTAVAFQIKMITADMRISVYKGYMEGSLNLEPYL